MTDLDKINDLEMAQYIADKFNIPELPGLVRRKLGLKEQMEELESKERINTIGVFPKNR